MDKTALILSIIPIGLSLFVIMTSTGNIWNAPDLDVHVEPNSDNTKPVDIIVRSIYNETNYLSLTADSIRDRDIDSHHYLQNIFSKEDAWVIDRIYHFNTTDGLSEKITISNLGQEQAHGVIIQILGSNVFKIVDYDCPEIMSSNQIMKEHGKKYLITQSRLSVQLPCVITINSIGESGINEVIVTAENTAPAAYPIDQIRYYGDLALLFTIIGYVTILITIYLASYIGLSFYRKKTINKTEPPKTMIDEIQDMIKADFGSDVSRLIRISEKLQKTSQLSNDDIEFLRTTTFEWDKRNRS